MQVKAIYEDGAINFAQPLRFKHRKFEVVVSIPEEELEANGESAMASTASLSTTAVRDDTYIPIGKYLDDILGPFRGKLGNFTSEEVREIWHEHLEGKYFGSK
jgi:hypothetical protein